MGECVQRRKIKIVMTFWLYNLELRLQLKQSALWNNSLLQCLFFSPHIREVNEYVLGCEYRHPSLLPPSVPFLPLLSNNTAQLCVSEQ